MTEPSGPLPPFQNDGGWLRVKGARTHNLANIDVDIPRGKFVVISGVSGSGKSSLAFDTLYAEGQRRYVESLSSYARQFLGQMKKPDCDQIEGLSPAISIDQKSGSHNPRSTVATVTEIMDYLRLLWARIGHPHCPECGKEVARRTVQEIVDDMLWRFEGHTVAVWAPAIRAKKGTHADLFSRLTEEGYLSGKVNGRDADFEKPPQLEKNLRHDIEVRMDRFPLTREHIQRLTESVESGLRLGNGMISIESLRKPSKDWVFTPESLSKSTKEGETIAYSEEFACPEHGAFLPEMSPRIFSFNSPLGACPMCQGLGVKRDFSPELIVDYSLTLSEGAIRPYHSAINRGWYQSQFRAIANHYAFNLHTPFKELDPDHQDILLYGSGSTHIHVKHASERGSHEIYRPWEGVIPRLARLWAETASESQRERYAAFMVDNDCPDCRGQKLNKAVRGVQVGGISLPFFSSLGIQQALAVTRCWREEENDGVVKCEGREDIKVDSLDSRSRFIGQDILKEVESRLAFLESVGLDYLTLDRRANTLSGGESQRIRLATQIGSRLTGVMYVLDEPSIGLHQRDNQRLLATLRELVALGNTLLVVEHDEETLRQADWLVDLGPGAGEAGGRLVSSDIPSKVMDNMESLTGAFLSGRRCIAIPETRKENDGRLLTIHGAKQNNLKEIDVEFPLASLVVVTGVSGSGKSSLVTDILAPLLQREIHNADVVVGGHEGVEGIDEIHKAIVIDQSPIGRTPRSNPATYSGAFDPIRKLFAQTQLSKERGYAPGRFSFNVKGGRCEACKGAGSIKLEMNFLPDVWVTCDICKGKRYNRETLEVTWRGRTIHDVLEMSITEAVSHFENHPRIHRILSTLNAVGLGYLRLGQPATQLSGGEAQRVKLASELQRPPHRHTLYTLDEPTTGLSLPDVEQLLSVLTRLRDKGHTVIIVEHHMDVIKSADWVIDLGPEGGDSGGHLVACGTPEDIVGVENSHTGKCLRDVL